jgi:YggT family protein
MPSALDNGFIFLINTIFDLLIFVFLIRLILVAIHADFNPLSQMVVKFTKPIVTPLKRVMPNIKRIELASVFIVILLECLKFCLLGLVMTDLPNTLGLLVLAIADSLRALVNLFFYAIILQAIMSWVNQGYSPAANLLTKITGPVVNPFRRIIPPIGGIDISPIPAMLMLQLIIILFITPMMSMGWTMAYQ